MIRKRLHTLRYKEIVTTGGHRDENDDWVSAETIENVIELSCRADVNSAGRTISNAQGQDFVYSFAIYFDAIPDSLVRGVEVEIINKGKVIGKGNVIMPFEYQGTNKIWI